MTDVSVNEVGMPPQMVTDGLKDMIHRVQEGEGRLIEVKVTQLSRDRKLRYTIEIEVPDYSEQIREEMRRA